MPFFRRKKNDEFVGLEEEECNLRDMFGEPPGGSSLHGPDEPAPLVAPSTPMQDSTTSSDYSPTSDSSSQDGIDDNSASSQQQEDEPQENAEAQELMNDNLELMREVVMKIREDEDYARNIYANCPRLQLLLNEHPDLRPLFEDPRFVVLNFEKVYRDAGGTLPGDEDANKPNLIQKVKKVIGTITSHPLFKVFKILMLIKKIVFFFSPTKFMGMLKSCLWPSLDDMELDADGLDPEDEDYEAQKTKLNLNQAADRLEDPEIQEQMQEAMDDPDKLEDLIENNKELRELRDSNPVCAEMMSDPETMKIISDPENLRALSECPDLITEDFANPDMLLDALEGDIDIDADVDADVDGDVDGDAEVDDDGEFSDDDDYSDEYSSEEEYSDEEEEEEQEDDDDDDDDGGGDGMLEDVEYERDDDDNRERSRSRGKARSANQKRDANRDEDREGGGGGGKFGDFLATIAEAGLGGMLEGDFDFGGGDEMEGLGEGGEDLGAVEEVAAGAEEGDFMEDYGEDMEGALEEVEDLEEEDGNEYLEEAEENLEDVEETEREPDEDELLDEDELMEQAEDGLEDVEETEREDDETTVQTDDVSEDQGVYATMEEIDEGAAGQGADLADEFDAEDRDRDKDKDKEQRAAEQRAARGGGGGFYGDYEDDGDRGDGGGFASGFKGQDDDDDWIRY